MQLGLARDVTQSMAKLGAILWLSVILGSLYLGWYLGGVTFNG
jgi:hypothetical protein